jgi:hypothetical protein
MKFFKKLFCTILANFAEYGGSATGVCPVLLEKKMEKISRCA